MAVEDTSRSRFRLKSITVEPIMFMYVYCVTANIMTYQALIYDKVCVQRFNSTVCDNLSNGTFKSAETEVQKNTSIWILYMNVISSIPSVMTVLFILGPFGDKVGRKIPLVMPLIGATLTYVCNLLNVVYIDCALEYLLIGSFLNGLFGGFVSALMAMYSYIAQIASPKHMTIRLGIVEGMIFLAQILGSGTSGILLDKTSFVFVFSLILVINLLAVVYILVWVDEIVTKKNKDDSDKDHCSTTLLMSVRDIACCVYHKRRYRHFKKLCLLMFVMFSLMVCNIGELDIALIFTRHAPFNWPQTTFGLFKGTESVIRGLGILAILPVLKRVLHAKDTAVAIIGVASKAISYLVFGVSRSTEMLFAGAVLGIASGFPGATIRSMCSRMVNRNEHGRMFSIIGAIESLSSLAATSMFNTIYNATLDLYPGFCFLLMSALMVICMFILAYLHYKMSRPDWTAEDPHSGLESKVTVSVGSGQTDERPLEASVRL